MQRYCGTCSPAPLALVYRPLLAPTRDIAIAGVPSRERKRPQPSLATNRTKFVGRHQLVRGIQRSKLQLRSHNALSRVSGKLTSPRQIGGQGNTPAIRNALTQLLRGSGGAGAPLVETLTVRAVEFRRRARAVDRYPVAGRLLLDVGGEVGHRFEEPQGVDDGCLGGGLRFVSMGDIFAGASGSDLSTFVDVSAGIAAALPTSPGA